MGRLDAAMLVAQVTERVYQVQSDPPVRKAASEFAADVVKAGRSGRRLADEAVQSWLRHGGVRRFDVHAGKGHR